MSFWQLEHADDLALVEQRTSRVFTYRQLAAEVRAFAEPAPVKRLGFVLCDNSLGAVVAYLSALQHRDAVCLLDASLAPQLLARMVDVYQPEWIAGAARHAGYQRSERGLLEREAPVEAAPLYADLALLLTTSGTTGSPKLVRLSYTALQANAAQIAQVLQLSTRERAITSLPMQYSYGLSVINSHLHAGGSLLLTADAAITRSFWDFATQASATSLAGVPYTYEMLQRLDLRALAPKSLHTFTQAGGRLRPELALQLAELGRFYTMYGQTEATARISYVPPERLLEKAGSIGISVPSGRLWLDTTTSELMYEGPNVMLGYAEQRSDLARGDAQHGLLHTGDLGACDAEGYFRITGRAKRFVKLFGLRVSLDEVEALLSRELASTVACTGTDDKLMIALEGERLCARAQEIVTSTYRIHRSVVKVQHLAAIPRSSQGKVDYAALENLGKLAR
jgi:long-chain acyl-CoA synthetase